MEPKLFSKTLLKKKVKAYLNGSTISLLCGGSTARRQQLIDELNKLHIPYRVSGHAWRGKVFDYKSTKHAKKFLPPTDSGEEEATKEENGLNP